MQRIPTLDGWRGIAILMVLGGHYSAMLLGEDRVPWWLWNRGTHGVCLFFVLSGFLITSLLLRERENTGRINLRGFYIRRAFRLVPVAWLYLLMLVLVGGSRRPSHLDMASCIFSFRNFVQLPPFRTITEHYWSLSVEEQFYIFWPSLLAFAGLIWSRRVAIAVALGVTAWRWWCWNSLMKRAPGLVHGTQYWADALMVGCLTALLLPELRPFLRRWMFWPLLAFFIFCVIRYRLLSPLHESICIALMLAITSQMGPFVPFEWKPLVWLGVVSYSVYVWQQFFMLWIDQSWRGLENALTLLAVCVLISHYLIEQPFRRLGHRLAKRLQRRAVCLEPALQGVDT